MRGLAVYIVLDVGVSFSVQSKQKSPGLTIRGVKAKEFYPDIYFADT